MTGMDVAARRREPRAGRASPRFSSPPPPFPEDDLFDEIFDWGAYCDSTQPLERHAHPATTATSPNSTTSYSSIPYSYISYSPSPVATAAAAVNIGGKSPRRLSVITQLAPPDIQGLSIHDHRQSGFYSMKAPYRTGHDSPTAISEYTSGNSPPELEQGGSSPSDHSGSVFLDHAEELAQQHLHHRFPDVVLRDAQSQDDEWTYPQTDLAKSHKHGYPPQLHVRADPRAAVAAHDARKSGTKRRHQGKEVDRRVRQLADPHQTADVRKSGACLPCRVTKTRCHDSGVCPTCRKAFPSESHLVCTRTTPAMAWPVMSKVPDFWTAQASAEQTLCHGPRFFTGHTKDISIFLGEPGDSSTLHATVQAYWATQDADKSASPRTIAFPREKVPSHEKLVRWVEGQIDLELADGFTHTLQSFLSVYSKDSNRKLPKYNLVRKVHTMSCFFRIWRMGSFWCRDPSGNIAQLPLSVQAQLRSFSRKALDSCEHDVMKLLDDCLSQHGSPKTEERLAIWASLWQLLLMYRDLFVGYKMHVGYLMQDPAEPSASVEKKATSCRKLTESFFPMLAVFYHYQFRTKKSVELSFDWLDGRSASHSHRADRELIRSIGTQLLNCRAQLYNDILDSPEEVDSMLQTFVVKHEVKKLNARKRTSKSTSSRSKRSRREDDGSDSGY